jgi:hypothetical protein
MGGPTWLGGSWAGSWWAGWLNLILYQRAYCQLGLAVPVWVVGWSRWGVGLAEPPRV